MDSTDSGRFCIKLKDRNTGKLFLVSYRGLAGQPKELMKACIFDGGHSLKVGSYHLDSDGNPYDKTIVCTECGYTACAKLDRKEERALRALESRPERNMVISRMTSSFSLF